jgi:two-component system response regulator FlrC
MMRARHILAAESDRNMRSALFTALTRLGHAVESAEDGEEAVFKFGNMKFDLALVDLRLGKPSGLKVLREFKRQKPEVPVIVMSQGGGVEEAVAVMREGAQDFLIKPFPAGVIEEALLRAFSKDEEKSFALFNGDGNGRLSSESLSHDKDKPIVAKSEIMVRLLMLAKKLAPSSATVLLQGESGTGKEVLARFIHNNSPRKDGPFVAVNCAGLPESLLESELFGHEKGAFTGALNRKPGKFDLADGGTLLLDEISEMDISIQAKLLRALQEGEIDPVGGKGPHKIDVRVIATTNRKLKAWVDEGKFRADLYYRLNVMPVFIPALRDRKDDILPLTEFFMEKYSLRNNRVVSNIEEDALNILYSHEWPGNIRELENTVARAVLMSRGDTIKAGDVFMDETGFMEALEKNSFAEEIKRPRVLVSGNKELDQKAKVDKEEDPETTCLSNDDSLSGAALIESENQSVLESDSLGQDPLAGQYEEESENLPVKLPMMTIDEMERRLIGRALNETSGNRTHAAKLLGISVRTLRNKLNEYRQGQLPEAGQLSEAPSAGAAMG